MPEERHALSVRAIVIQGKGICIANHKRKRRNKMYSRIIKHGAEPLYPAGQQRLVRTRAAVTRMYMYADGEVASSASSGSCLCSFSHTYSSSCTFLDCTSRANGLADIQPFYLFALYLSFFFFNLRLDTHYSLCSRARGIIIAQSSYKVK